MTDDFKSFKRVTRFVREAFDHIRPQGEGYLVKGRIPAHGVGFLVGSSGALKTFLAIDLALKIASGEGVFQARTRKGGVVYVPAEAPNGCRKRVQAWREANNAKGLPFQLIPQAPDLSSQEDVAELAYAISLAAMEFGEIALGLVVIDTLAASIPGADENSGAHMSLVMANARWLADETGAFVLIVTHTGKEEARGIRGWSGQYAAADMVITMTRSEGVDVAIGRLTKLKEGESGYRFAIQLEQIGLGADEDDDPITSAVVTYEDAPPPVPKRRRSDLNSSEQIVLGAIAYLTDNGPTTALPRSIEGARKSDRAVTRAEVRTRALSAGFAIDDEKPNSTNQRFSRAIRGLIAAEKIRVDGDLFWLL